MTGNKDRSLLFKEERWKGKRSKWDGSLAQPREQSWIREPPPSGESGTARLSGDTLKELILSVRRMKREIVTVKWRSEQEQSDVASSARDATNRKRHAGWFGCRSSGSVLSKI